MDCTYKSNFSSIFLSSYDPAKISCHFELLDNIEAPIYVGDTIGMLVYEYDEAPIGSIDITATEDIKKAGYIDYIRQLMNNFF